MFDLFLRITTAQYLRAQMLPIHFPEGDGFCSPLQLPLSALVL